MGKATNDLDLHKLEVFYWVTELASFSLAAEHLSLRQPTISAHMRTLERQIGAKLCDRIHGRVVPTPTGKILKQQATRLLKLKSETLAALDAVRGKVRGEFKLGGSSVPGEYILPGKLGKFVREFPDVKPILRIGDTEEIVEAVLDGEVEVGFVGFKTIDRRLSWQSLWVDEMVVAVARSHRWARLKTIALPELNAERFLVRETGSGTLRSFSRLVGRKVDGLQITMELGSAAAIKEAVIEGFGVSVLSRATIRREVSAGLIKEVRFKGLKLERQFHYVVQRERTLSSVAKAFLQSLK